MKMKRLFLILVAAVVSLGLLFVHRSMIAQIFDFVSKKPNKTAEKVV